MKAYDPERLTKRIRNGDVVLVKIGPLDRRTRERHLIQSKGERPTSIEKILVGIFTDEGYYEPYTGADKERLFSISIGYTRGKLISNQGGRLYFDYRGLFYIEKLKKSRDLF